MHILVVDDSADARAIVQTALEAAGYRNLTFAASGDEALSLLGVEPRSDSGWPVDAILLDVVMPGRDGVETCACLRADERYKDVPVIMVTSQSAMKTLSDAFMAGANDYIRKPFDFVELTARLRSALRLKGELDRRKARELELLRRAQQANGEAGSGRRAFDATLAKWAHSNTAHAGIIAVQIEALDAMPRPHRQQSEALAESVIASQRVRLDSCFANYGDGLFVIAVPFIDQEEAEYLCSSIRHSFDMLQRDAGFADPPKLRIAAFLPPALGEDPRRMLVKAVDVVSRRSGLPHIEKQAVSR